MTGAPLISIVDDDRWARSGLETFVEAIGYGVRSFESAESFVGSGGIADTVCLIVDLNLPGMSGLDLRNYLRSKGHDIPIIVMTGSPIDQHRSRVTDSLTHFVAKPIDGQVLVDCLARAVGPSS